MNNAANKADRSIILAGTSMPQHHLQPQHPAGDSALAAPAAAAADGARPLRLARAVPHRVPPPLLPQPDAVAPPACTLDASSLWAGQQLRLISLQHAAGAAPAASFGSAAGAGELIQLSGGSAAALPQQPASVQQDAGDPAPVQVMHGSCDT